MSVATAQLGARPTPPTARRAKVIGLALTGHANDIGTHTLIQCSPDNEFERVGGFDDRVNNMAIDEDGVFYAGARQGLCRISLSPWIKGIQV
jgi:hypothetical protein